MLNIKEALNQLFTRNLKTGELFKIDNPDAYYQLLMQALKDKEELKNINIDYLEELKTSLSVSTVISLEEWERLIASQPQKLTSEFELHQFIFKQSQHLTCKLSFSARSIKKFKHYYPSYELFVRMFNDRFCDCLLNNHVNREYQFQIFKYIDRHIEQLGLSSSVKKVFFKTTLNCDKAMLTRKLYQDFNQGKDSAPIYLSEENLYDHIIRLGCVSILPSLETKEDLLYLNELQLDNQQSTFDYGA